MQEIVGCKSSKPISGRVAESSSSPSNTVQFLPLSMAEEGWKLALTLEEITFFLKLYGWQFSLQLDG
jgi:hypothetical protein